MSRSPRAGPRPDSLHEHCTRCPTRKRNLTDPSDPDTRLAFFDNGSSGSCRRRKNLLCAREVRRGTRGTGSEKVDYGCDSEPSGSHFASFLRNRNETFPGSALFALLDSTAWLKLLKGQCLEARHVQMCDHCMNIQSDWWARDSGFFIYVHVRLFFSFMAALALSPLLAQGQCWHAALLRRTI